MAPPASCDEVGAPAGADESAPHMPATTAAHPPGTAAADTPASDGVAPGSPGAQQLQQQLEEALGRAAAAEREQHEWQSLYQSEAAEAAQLSRRYDHLVRYVTAALTQRHQQQRVRQAAGGAPRLHCIREEGAAGGQAPAPRPPEGQAGAAAARRPSHKLSAHARAPRALPQAANGTAPALPAAPPAGKPHPKRSPPPPPLRSLAARHTASVPSLLPPSFPYGGGSPGMDSEFEERLRRGLAMSPGVRGSAASAGAASSSGGGRAQRSAPPPAASMSSSGSESDISSDASSSSGSAGSSFAPHMPDASGAATAPAAAGAASSDLATRSNSASATVAAVAAALGSNDLLVLERQLSAGLGSLINMLDPGILDAAHIGGGRPRRSRGRRSAEGKSKDSDAATQAARTGGSALAADAGDAAAASGGAAAAAAGDEDSGNPGSASNLEDEDGEGRGHWAQLPPATRQPRSPWELSIHGPADAVCALAGVPPGGHTCALSHPTWLPHLNQPCHPPPTLLTDPPRSPVRPPAPCDFLRRDQARAARQLAADARSSGSGGAAAGHHVVDGGTGPGLLYVWQGREPGHEQQRVEHRQEGERGAGRERGGSGSGVLDDAAAAQASPAPLVASISRAAAGTWG